MNDSGESFTMNLADRIRSMAPLYRTPEDIREGDIVWFSDLAKPGLALGVVTDTRGWYVEVATKSETPTVTCLQWLALRKAGSAIGLDWKKAFQ